MTRSRILAVAVIAAAATLSACAAPAPKLYQVAAPSSSGATAAPAAATQIGINEQIILATATPAALSAYIDAKGGHSAVAVVDQTTGATVKINQDRVFQTASIVKFDILASRLYQHQTAGTSMSANEKKLAFAMITQSDNNAATALFSMDHGASGVTAANKAFGLKDTVPASAWGKTRTTSADQVRLLTAVMSPKGPLSEANRAYMLSLMSQVEPDQAWGITAAATSSATGVYVKNGWVEMDSYGHLEGDNSIGRIVEPGHDFLIAVMSNYNKSDQAGEAILGSLSKIAVTGLRLETGINGTTITSTTR